MVHVTQSAAKELKKIKEHVVKEKPNSVLRLVPSGAGQLSLGLSTSREPGDQELYYKDEQILVVDSQLSTMLSDVTLDFEEAPGGGHFVFTTGPQEQR